MVRGTSALICDPPACLDWSTTGMGGGALRFVGLSCTAKLTFVCALPKFVILTGNATGVWGRSTLMGSASCTSTMLKKAAVMGTLPFAWMALPVPVLAVVVAVILMVSGWKAGAWSVAVTVTVNGRLNVADAPPEADVWPMGMTSLRG